MSPRLGFVLLFVILPVSARRGGGGAHHYPSSGGMSGHGHVTNTVQSVHTGRTQAATYPHSTGISGNNNYPKQHTTNYVHKTEIHHHYAPPQQINYGSGYHPVYHGSPPLYIYTYRDSGSRYDSLLTGLALYNLGRMSAHNHDHYYDSRREYTASPGEVCKLQIVKSNGEYEETRIECRLMSSFIWEAEREQNSAAATKVVSNTVTSTVNVTNTVDSNGTVVTTSTVKNTTVVDALEAKGPSIRVTSEMNCYMIRISRNMSVLKKKVECGLLQAYARSSFNNSCRNLPQLAILISVIAYCVF